jgi:hypothetical protein
MLYFALFRCVTSYLFYFWPWPGQSIPPGYVEPPKYMKVWHTYSLKQNILHNLQHKSLLRIQQLTTNHTVQQCTCISEEDPYLSIMGAVLDWYYFAMVNGSGSLKILDIYYESDLTLIEYCFSRKGVKWHFMWRTPKSKLCKLRLW